MIEGIDGYYRTVLIEEPQSSGVHTWLALHPDLPGCNAAGQDHEDALEGLALARDAWLATADKHGHPIPQPLDEPLTQIVYAANPTAYFNGQQGGGASSHTIDMQPSP